MAGGTLCTLYGLIKFFGKDVVNQLFMVYLAFCVASLTKTLLVQAIGDSMDKKALIEFRISQLDFDVRISPLDLMAFAFSLVIVGLYMWTDHWILNNVIAIAFSVQAIESLFLGNFRVGFLLLSLLFFYDIFFVFGTDVMLTVAKNINAPIKILFAGKWVEDDPDGKREYSLLGLGDIVLPGIFISMALRFDVIRSLKNVDWEQIKSEKAEGSKVYDEIMKTIKTCPKTYFYACLVGYLLAIALTTVIMIIYDHGQPALLYLVPGVCLSVIFTSLARGEFNYMWNHDENVFIGAKTEAE